MANPIMDTHLEARGGVINEFEQIEEKWRRKSSFMT